MTKYFATSVLFVMFAASQCYAVPIDHHAELFSISPQQQAYAQHETMRDLPSYARLPVATHEVAAMDRSGILNFNDFIDTMPTRAASASFHPGTHQANPVPEPSTLILLGAGCIAVSVLGKRKAA
jgi:hypothetical protein